MKYFTITPTTDEADLKRQYRILSKNHHPDVSGGDHRVMAEINLEYTRALDMIKGNGKPSSGPGEFFREDIFEQAFFYSDKFAEIYFPDTPKGRRDRKIFEFFTNLLKNLNKKEPI